MLGLLLTVTDVLSTYADDVIINQSFYISPASFPVVLGDFGCDLTCQASSGRSDSARDWPGYEADISAVLRQLMVLYSMVL